MIVRIRHGLRILAVLLIVLLGYGVVVFQVMRYAGHLEDAVAFAVMGTSIAIVTSVLALLKDPIFDYINRPRLRLEFHPHDKRDCHLTSFSDPQTNQIVAQALYFRLRVYNDGWSAAEDVQVNVQEVSTQSGTSMVSQEEFTAQRLFWSHWKATRFELTIPSGVHNYCDFGFILEPGKQVNGIPSQINDRLQFWLDVILRPNYGRSSLDPGTYQILVTASGKNAPLVSRRIRVEWTGQWHEDIEELLKESLKFS